MGITVHYDDGDSVTHHNYSDFESYHPTTPCKPVGISIDFIYLIKFQGRDVPEKQEIHVSIETDLEYGHHRIKRWFRGGIFLFRILHTERTWATDIAGLLKGHAATIVKKPSSLVNFIIQNNSELIMYLSIVIFSTVLLFWSSHTMSLLDNPIANLSLEKYWVRSVTIFSILFAFLLAVTNFFQYHISLSQSSMILLTENDIKNQEKIGRKYFWIWVVYIFGWLLNILAGVIASYLYSKFA